MHAVVQCLRAFGSAPDLQAADHLQVDRYTTPRRQRCVSTAGDFGPSPVTFTNAKMTFVTD